MLSASINVTNGLHLARLRLLYSTVVVSGECTCKVTRGSWWLCDDDPGKGQCPGSSCAQLWHKDLQKVNSCGLGEDGEAKLVPK